MNATPLVSLRNKMKILHLEDDKASQCLFETYFNKTCTNIEISHKEDCMDYYPALIGRPDVIVIDWTLRDGSIKYLLPYLRDYKGKVIVFSANNESLIDTWIRQELGSLPPHFSIYSKIDEFAYTDMVEEVKLYGRRIKKDICA